MMVLFQQRSSWKGGYAAAGMRVPGLRLPHLRREVPRPGLELTVPGRRVKEAARSAVAVAGWRA